MPKGSDLLTSAEVAEILGVDRSTVNRWTQAGKLSPFHRNPGRTGAKLYRRAQIEALAEKLRSAA